MSYAKKLVRTGLMALTLAAIPITVIGPATLRAEYEAAPKAESLEAPSEALAALSPEILVDEIVAELGSEDALFAPADALAEAAPVVLTVPTATPLPTATPIP